MKRSLFLVALLIVPAAMTAVGRSSAAAARPPLLATRDEQSSSRLFYVDPVSLRPLAGRSLPLDFHWGDFVRSPDGSTLALSRNDAPELRFVRLRGLKFVGTMSFQEGQFVRLVSWPSRHLLFALLDSSPERVLAIDPTARKVLWRRSIRGSVIDIQPAAGGVVALAAPTGRIGAARVVAIGAGGSTRSIALDRIRAGFHRHSLQDSIGKIRTPGLAVDPGGGRAFVVGAGEPVVQVSLASGRVSYHGGLRALQKAVSGPRRQAIWLGNGLLGVTGSDASLSTDKQGNVRESLAPTGLTLLNTRTWTSRRLQEDTDAAIAVSGRLLAYRSGYDSGTKTQAGSGLTIYRLDGTRVRHLLGRTPISWVQAQNGLAYVWLAKANGLADHVVVINPASGRILARESRSIVLLASS
jgi:hypothetical protein